MATNGTVQLSGKTAVEIAALVKSGELSKKKALDFVIERGAKQAASRLEKALAA